MLHLLTLIPCYKLEVRLNHSFLWKQLVIIYDVDMAKIRQELLI